jgi:hypothetical protein
MRCSNGNDNQTFKKSHARSNWSRMPFNFNFLMKCIKGCSVDQDEDQAELNNRIRCWIQNSSSDYNQPKRLAKFPMEHQESGPTIKEPQHQLHHQVLRQQTIPVPCIPKPTFPNGIKDSVGAFDIVESVVAMVIAPPNHLPQTVDNEDNNPLHEFQSKIARIVPDSIEILRFHTQKLLAWKDSLDNQVH